jgi:hypothetical protein
MGRQMLEGTGVDASLAGNGFTATSRKQKKHGKYKKHNTNNNKINNNNIALVIKPSEIVSPD